MQNESRASREEELHNSRQNTQASRILAMAKKKRNKEGVCTEINKTPTGGGERDKNALEDCLERPFNSYYLGREGGEEEKNLKPTRGTRGLDETASD